MRAAKAHLLVCAKKILGNTNRWNLEGIYLKGN